MSEDIPLPHLLEGDKLSKITYKLGSHLLQIHKFVASTTKDKGIIWLYEPDVGIWHNEGEDEIKHWLTDYLGDRYKKRILNEICSYIRNKVYQKGLMMGGPKHKIVMKNGIFNFETWSFENAFCQDEHHISGIPVIYDPNAECPNIDKWFREVVVKQIDNEWIPQESLILGLKEFMGYCLYKSYPEAIMIMLIGEGATGKSTLMKLLTSFVGDDYTVDQNPQQLTENRFSVGQLRGKLVCSAGDIPNRPLEYIGIIKQLTGNDKIKGEHKNSPQFYFYNYAKLIWSGNEPPKVKGATSAFFRRMFLFDFPRIFREDLKDKPRNQGDLLAELTTPEELSGLFLQAAGGLRRMLKNKTLTGAKPVPERTEDYLERSDMLELFAKKFVYMNPQLGSWDICKNDLWELFCGYCTSKGQVADGYEYFVRHMNPRVRPCKTKKKVNSQGSKVAHWIGLGVYWDELIDEVAEYMDAEFRKHVNGSLVRKPDNDDDSTTSTTSTTISSSLTKEKDEYNSREAKNSGITGTSGTDEIFEGSDKEPKPKNTEEVEKE